MLGLVSKARPTSNWICGHHLLSLFVFLKMSALSEVSSAIRNLFITLAGVAKWLKHQPLNQRVLGSIPGVGHIPGFQICSLASSREHVGGN